MKQQSILKEVSTSGIGLHTGQEATITICPAPVNHGVKFQRIDLEKAPYINADVNKVSSTQRSTTIAQGDAQVHTVEHLLSALTGLGIDNVLVKIDGPEVPILTGNALPFVELLQEAGIEEQEKEKEYFVVEAPIKFKDEETGSEIIALPADNFQANVMIDFNSEVLGQQYADFNSDSDYVNEIAPCRTFVFAHELEFLFNSGLIKGGSLDNAIVLANKALTEEQKESLAKHSGRPKSVFEGEGVLNKSDLRFINEPARHKLLDLIGDISLLGKPIKGKIFAIKPGHKTNVEFTKLLKAEYQKQRKLKGKPKYDPNKEPIMNTVEVSNWLPHRYPFLLVDKIIELSDKHVVGVKNVTFNENFFMGHFPNNPVFPGVLQIEAMAQTGGILALSTVENPSDWDTYFLKIEEAKFKAKVLPGDTLIIKMELTAPIRRGLCQMYGIIYVGDKIVSEGLLTAQIINRTKQ